MLTEAAFLSLLAALFSTMNPMGNLALFASIVGERAPGDRLRIAWTAVGSAVLALVIVAWIGEALLDAFGISIDALRTAGGLILLRIGFNMLNNDASHAHGPHEVAQSRTRESIAVVPLAIPILAGPSAMSVVLVAASQHPDVIGRLEVNGAIALIGVVCGLAFTAEAPLARLLGHAGLGVVTRVMGMLLTAIAVGMVAEGVAALLPGLAG